MSLKMMRKKSPQKKKKLPKIDFFKEILKPHLKFSFKCGILFLTMGRNLFRSKLRFGKEVSG